MWASAGDDSVSTNKEFVCKGSLLRPTSHQGDKSMPVIACFAICGRRHKANVETGEASCRSKHAARSFLMVRTDQRTIGKRSESRKTSLLSADRYKYIYSFSIIIFIQTFVVLLPLCAPAPHLSSRQAGASRANPRDNISRACISDIRNSRSKSRHIDINSLGELSTECLTLLKFIGRAHASETVVGVAGLLALREST